MKSVQQHCTVTVPCDTPQAILRVHNIHILGAATLHFNLSDEYRRLVSTENEKQTFALHLLVARQPANIAFLGQWKFHFYS
jgi:hypothetical protein